MPTYRVVTTIYQVVEATSETEAANKAERSLNFGYEDYNADITVVAEEMSELNDD